MGLDENNAVAKSAIESGKTALGIEFGSTRIKAVLIDENQEVIAFGRTVLMRFGRGFRTVIRIWQDR